MEVIYIMSEKKKLRSIRMYNVISYEYTSDGDKVVAKKTTKTVKKGEKKNDTNTNQNAD